MPAAVAPHCPSVEPILPFDEQAFQARVTRHLALVRLLVDRLKRRLPQSIEAEELYGVGLTALVTAARSGNPPFNYSVVAQRVIVQGDGDGDDEGGCANDGVSAPFKETRRRVLTGSPGTPSAF